METRLKMSNKDIRRLEVMQKASDKRMSQKEAGVILSLSRRQVKRLLKRYRKPGAAGLISKQCGRKSTHRLRTEVKRKALDFLKTKSSGFGPTLAHEKWVAQEPRRLSDERLRKLMIEEGLWKPRKAKKIVAHPPRERRAGFGELVQIDGSPHDWCEGRAAACGLLVLMDHATGQLVQWQLADNESFFSCRQAAAGYFKPYGKPVACDHDTHSIFRVSQPSPGSSDALTQFGRALPELDLQIICATTPQAQGRGERVIQTVQDRLPKEMRLRNLRHPEDGKT